MHLKCASANWRTFCLNLDVSKCSDMNVPESDYYQADAAGISESDFGPVLKRHGSFYGYLFILVFHAQNRTAKC